MAEILGSSPATNAITDMEGQDGNPQASNPRGSPAGLAAAPSLHDDSLSLPVAITAPPRWSHQRTRWKTGKIGFPEVSSACARQYLAPHEWRGQYKEHEYAVRKEVERSFGFIFGTGRRPKVHEVNVYGLREETVSSLRVRRYQLAHLVVGVMSKKTGETREILMDDIVDERLFEKIRQAVRALRPWWKRALSLKSVQGFTLYRCYPGHEYHEVMELDDKARAVLRELWHDYNRSRWDQAGRWLAWVQQQLNRGDFVTARHLNSGLRADNETTSNTNPMTDPPPENETNAVEDPRANNAPCLTLSLVIKWSITKIAIYGFTPILLSLAIGFWFQYSQEGDRVAVVQTAWTISSFIIGASQGTPQPQCC